MGCSKVRHTRKTGFEAPPQRLCSGGRTVVETVLRRPVSVSLETCSHRLPHLLSHSSRSPWQRTFLKTLEQTKAQETMRCDCQAPGSATPTPRPGLDLHLGLLWAVGGMHWPGHLPKCSQALMPALNLGLLRTSPKAVWDCPMPAPCYMLSSVTCGSGG